MNAEVRERHRAKHEKEVAFSVIETNSLTHRSLPTSLLDFISLVFDHRGMRHVPAVQKYYRFFSQFFFFLIKPKNTQYTCWVNSINFKTLVGSSGPTSMLYTRWQHDKTVYFNIKTIPKSTKEHKHLTSSEFNSQINICYGLLATLE